MSRKYSPLFFILLISCFCSCNQSTKSAEQKPIKNEANTPIISSNNIITIHYKKDFHHQNIKNNSKQQVDLLFNSFEKYLNSRDSNEVSFFTECMSCQPVQKYKGGLLFGKRLFITSDSIQYFKENINIPEHENRISVISDDREGRNLKFNFQNGNGSIKHGGVSCNDANYYQVNLSYKNGNLLIDSLINASFFEYDLDSDGECEQYLLGLRNCSQELVLLRTKK